MKYAINKPFFYLEPAAWGETCILKDQEAQHLNKALRIGVDEEVCLLDGAGTKGVFRVCALHKRHVELQCLHVEYAPVPHARAIMAVAWGKATRRSFFMEKIVELGVHEVWLWQGEHSQGRLPQDIKTSWQVQMIAGLKQSGNPWLPVLHTLPQGAQELVQRAATASYKILPWEQEHDVPMLTPDMVGQTGETVYVVGPEGGFSAKEIALFQEHDFQPASLGQRVLRCETAALLCLGIHWWASQLPRPHTEHIQGNTGLL